MNIYIFLIHVVAPIVVLLHSYGRLTKAVDPPAYERV